MRDHSVQFDSFESAIHLGDLQLFAESADEYIRFCDYMINEKGWNYHYSGNWIVFTSANYSEIYLERKLI